ncbi:MAG: nucleotide exchange factor GrpE [Omnitrophica bacterium RIFCSPHIGHO2_02_FULL_51_18]|nr:MAG: nucleotide exchange factor GrpE [Omnitrophica bacterium RIFCSPHIGHO2_02_FULL_51_18]
MTEDPRSIEALENKVKDYWDQILRLRAEFENTKKRLDRDKLDAIRYANEALLAEILPVVDNFDRAMASLSEGHDPEKVKQGLKIAQDELHKILEEHGVEVVKSVGQDFDPKFHEAVAVLETSEMEDGKVVDEIQRGYLLNGRLIRPSWVRIAKKKE